MRRLQRRPRPFDQAIDIRGRQLYRGDIERLLALAAPDSHFDGGFVSRRALDFPELRDHVAVDRQYQIALLQDVRRRGAADHAHHGQCLTLGGVVLRELFRPVLRKPDLAGRGQRLHGEFRLQGVQLLARPDPVEHVGHEVDRNAAIVLGQLAAAFVRETRPQAQDATRLVGQHAVELERRIDQLHDLDVAVTEPHGAG